jgi:DNA-binding transcriptional ArsR family regulator
MDPIGVTPSPKALRALSHPTRLRMLGILRSEGPATATTLATRLGLNTGATSYHLRQLAEHGFIEEEAERGSGRDRWWRARHAYTTIDTDDVAPADQDALDAYLQSVAVTNTQLLQAAVEERALLPQDWRGAGTLSDYHLRLTASGARALIERMHELLMGAKEAGEETEGAADFVVQLNGFLRPGQLGGDPS